MMHPAAIVRRSRRHVIMAQSFMALAAGALVWSGVAMIGMGMNDIGSVSIGAAFAIVVFATQFCN